MSIPRIVSVPFNRFWIKEEEAEKNEEKFGDEKFAATVERKLRSVCRGAHNNVRHTTICGCEGIKVRCKTLLRKILAKLLRQRNATPFLIEDVFVKRGTWDVWTWEKKKGQGKNKGERETSGCFAQPIQFDSGKLEFRLGFGIRRTSSFMRASLFSNTTVEETKKCLSSSTFLIETLRLNSLISISN